MNPATIATDWANQQWEAQADTAELNATRARQVTEKKEALLVALEAAWEEPDLLPTYSAERYNAAALYRLMFGRGIES